MNKASSNVSVGTIVVYIIAELKNVIDGFPGLSKSSIQLRKFEKEPNISIFLRDDRFSEFHPNMNSKPTNATG